ncbi:MAG: hypothetical protein HZC36_07265 [Armatimonadetes bacterium]|nr:hypothetical protein [Armatimonadota bacterium]
MDCYEIWVNLQPGVKDLEFVEAVNVYLGYLKGIGKVEAYRVRRRKLGFGPESLGEWNITIECASLAQLDEAFLRVATRESQIETMHAAVFSKVCGFKSGLYRDFPDEVRARSHGGA